jgi:hypothetical protein
VESEGGWHDHQAVPRCCGYSSLQAAKAMAECEEGGVGMTENQRISVLCSASAIKKSERMDVRHIDIGRKECFST